MRNFTTKVNDTAPLSSGVLDAAEDNARFDELENAVTAAGITLDAPTGPDTRTDMLAESMTRHAGAALACTDSGSANAYVFSMIGDYVAPTALVTELRVRAKIGHANTTASTLNAFGLGVRPIVDHTYAPLTAGALDGRDAEFIFRASVGASGSWVLPAWSNALYVGQVPASPPSVTSGEGWSVDGSNHGNLNFPGLTNLATVDPTDVFARYVSAGGVNHHRGITGAQLMAALNGGGRLNGLQVITSSGTYTKTANTTTALVIATGGGGGGAGGGSPGATLTGGGGGAGGTAISLVDLSGVSTVAVTIGAGGAGGVGAADGSWGGSTTFGGLTAGGGGGGGIRMGVGTGTTTYGSGGSSGGASGGAMNLGGCGGGSGGAVDGGVGGSSFWGGGGAPGGDYNFSRTNGAGGAAFGAGGGGADGGGNGGAGHSGCVFILEFA